MLRIITSDTATTRSIITTRPPTRAPIKTPVEESSSPVFAALAFDDDDDVDVDVEFVTSNKFAVLDFANVGEGERDGKMTGVVGLGRTPVGGGTSDGDVDESAVGD